MPKYAKGSKFGKFYKIERLLMGKIVGFALLFMGVFSIKAAAQGRLSGDIMANVNFFERDPEINAANNPLYDNYLSGGEGWLSLRYYYKGFTATLRADAFHNSNAYNPTQALNGFGIGAWSISKEYHDLTVTGGYIYDQIGSGILFRTYEDRGLLIDNALVGLRLKYQLTDNILLKAFTGQQKFLFDRYKPVIKAFNAEGSFSLGEKAFIVPGIGALNRTLDQTSMDIVVSSINSQDTATRFVPRYNMYAFTAYNNLTWGDVNWYIEGCLKTHETILKDDILQDKAGNVLFTTLGYARKGFAINLTGKRTEDFAMRTSPNEILIRGMMNWQPIIARLRPQRLMARYTPASQNLSEIGAGADILISPNENLDLNLNYTHINTLEDVELYREAYAQVDYNGWEDVKVHGGIQYMRYNQELYQIKPGVPIITALTPFFEVTYKFTSTKSIRFEGEAQFTEQDFGSWVFALLEYNIAPKWSFALSDMYNYAPGPNAATGSQHYYQAFVAHTKGPHRFTAAYVKQVEGINCTGGVCRYEPAFSGIRFGINSSF